MFENDLSHLREALVLQQGRPMDNDEGGSSLFGIACMDIKGGIGFQGDLPWHYPADLNHFKKITDNRVCIMGSNTLESLPSMLPNRYTIALTSKVSETVRIPGGALVPNMDEALMLAGKTNYGRATAVCGGASIYKALLPKCNYLYLTVLNHEFPTDTKLPFNWIEWETVDQVFFYHQQVTPSVNCATAFKLLKRRVMIKS